MGRATGGNTAARSAVSKRRGKRGKHLSAEARAFINGTADKATIRLDPTKVARGPEYVLGRSQGAGAHGKSGTAANRAERKNARKALRSTDDY